MKSLLLAVLVVSIGCTKKGPETIVIGNFGSMTGAEATFGISTKQGIELAIEEWNKSSLKLTITKVNQKKLVYQLRN
jgi:ABC-type branched-subunit amino acid transport system substrate-binding protein